MLSAIVQTRKGTSLHDDASFKPFLAKIHKRLTSVGEPEKKIKKIQNWCCNSRIRPDVPLRPIGRILELRYRFVEVINCAKFHYNRLRGLDSVVGLSLTIPIGFRCRFNTGRKAVRL